MRLSPHFSLDELTHSETAARLGIDNTPPADVIETLRRTAAYLEDVRARLGVPLIVSSGYRCILLNRALKSRDDSQHLKGEAVDFIAPAFGRPRQIVDALQDSEVPYDQLLLEFDRWVHISFSRRNRRQALVIDNAGTRPLTA